MRTISFFALALTAGQTPALEPITPPDAPIVVFITDKAYDSVKEDLELAITGRGLNISSTLHIGDMYARTAQDLGLDKAIYKKAESIEFCSIKMAYDMSLAHPANISTCPLTIALYIPAEGPDQVQIAFRRPFLLGDGAVAAKALTDMLTEIAQEAAQ